MRKHLGKLTTEIILSKNLDMKIRKTHTKRKVKTLIPFSLSFTLNFDKQWPDKI